MALPSTRAVTAIASARRPGQSATANGAGRAASSAAAASAKPSSAAPGPKKTRPRTASAVDAPSGTTLLCTPEPDPVCLQPPPSQADEPTARAAEREPTSKSEYQTSALTSTRHSANLAFAQSHSLTSCAHTGSVWRRATARACDPDSPQNTASGQVPIQHALLVPVRYPRALECGATRAQPHHLFSLLRSLLPSERLRRGRGVGAQRRRH